MAYGCVRHRDESLLSVRIKMIVDNIKAKLDIFTHHSMKAPTVNLADAWSIVASYTILSRYSPLKSFWHPLEIWLNGLRGHSRFDGEKEYLCPYRQSNPASAAHIQPLNEL